MNESAKCEQTKSYQIRLGSDESFTERITLADPVPSGRQILQKSGRRPEKEYQLLLLTPDGDLEEIGLDETIDIRTRGVEKFFVFETDCLRAFEIDDRRFLWGDKAILESTLKFLAGVSSDYTVWQERRGEDDLRIDPGVLANLEDTGVEVFFSAKDQTNAG